MTATQSVFLALAVGGAVWTQTETPQARLQQPVTCLKGLDPVALAHGQEQPGDDERFVVHGRFRYLFASAENKTEFEKQPDRYSIQLGGGCGRMGPLSGVGSPDRFLVHDGRIYIFASDQCLSNFKLAPEKHIELDEAPPHGNEAQLQRGLALVERALDGFGGAARVDAVTSLEFKRVRVYQADGEDKEQISTMRIVFPDRFRIDEVWHSGSAADFVSGETGFRMQGNQAWPMDPIVRRELIKSFRRNPLVLLKARNEPGFRAVATGRGTVLDQEVEWLTIGLDGATSTLGVDTSEGRVLSIRYRGRAPAAIGEISRTFSEFRDVDGITIPFSLTTYYSSDAAGAARQYAAVALNPKISDTLFAIPK